MSPFCKWILFFHFIDLKPLKRISNLLITPFFLLMFLEQETFAAHISQKTCDLLLVKSIELLSDAEILNLSPVEQNQFLNDRFQNQFWGKAHSIRAKMIQEQTHQDLQNLLRSSLLRSSAICTDLRSSWCRVLSNEYSIFMFRYRAAAYDLNQNTWINNLRFFHDFEEILSPTPQGSLYQSTERYPKQLLEFARDVPQFHIVFSFKPIGKTEMMILISQGIFFVGIGNKSRMTFDGLDMPLGYYSAHDLEHAHRFIDHLAQKARTLSYNDRSYKVEESHVRQLWQLLIRHQSILKSQLKRIMSWDDPQKKQIALEMLFQLWHEFPENLIKHLDSDQDLSSTYKYLLELSSSQLGSINLERSSILWMKDELLKSYGEFPIKTQ